jgi:enoyl-[acyl-carrier protein] reductase II
MKTRMTELFGIKHPIMLAGMNWLTKPKLVSAVSNAGGLGVLSCQQYDPISLRQAIRNLRDLTDKPFGVNITLGMGSEPLVKVVLEEKVGIVNYALGRPPEITALINAVHGYGGKVIGTIAMSKHAVRSEQLGSDMLNITGYEAAAHSGNVGSIVLVPSVTSAVKIPCIAAGGYANGRGLAAALAMGAEGISMGTRLAATQEAEVADTLREVWVKSSEEDTVIDPAFDGINCRVLKNEAAEKLLLKKSALPILDAMSAGLYMKKELKLSWGDMIRQADSLRRQPIGIGSGHRGLGSMMRFAVGSRLFRKATTEGDVKEGILMMGQTAGLINDIPTVAEVLERTVAEAEEIIKKMNVQIGA